MTNKIVRNPSMLKMPKQTASQGNAAPETTKIPKFGKHKNEYNPNYQPSDSAMSIGQQEEFYRNFELREKKKQRQIEEEKYVNWDAVLAELQLADSEDLTTSIWRGFKYRFQQPVDMGPNLPIMTGKEFNEINPPDETYGEAPVDPNKTLNEVQQMMVKEGRMERKGYLDRIAKGKDNILQMGANFGASIIGGATAADVAIAFIAPQVELGLIGMRHAPKILKGVAKIMQGLRKSQKLKGTILANMLENLAVESFAIPIEDIARKEKGVKEFTTAEIAGRVVMGLLFQAGLTSLVHTIKHSDFWRNMFETNPEKAVKKFNEQTKLLDEGVPFDEDTLLDSWEQMTPDQKQEWAAQRLTVEPLDVKSDVPRFEEVEDVFHKYVDEILEIEYQNKLADYEAKGSPEGVEPPKKETFNEVERTFDDAKTQFKDVVDEFVNCLKG